MKELAPIVWKNEKRSITCYSSRNFGDKTTSKEDCNPFEGSPFKEFWHHIDVYQFPSGSIFYKPLHTDFNYADEWKLKFSYIPVLAFVGAPSSFPTNSEAIKLSKYIHFTKTVIDKALKFREEREFARQPYLAVHLRHGPDWVRACELIHDNTDLKQLFSSQQCMGDKNKLTWKDRITFDLCLPSTQQVLDGILNSLSRYNDQKMEEDKIKYIYIATNHNNESLWLRLNETICHPSRPTITLITPTITFYCDQKQKFKENKDSPHFLTDLYLSSYANAFIGNCISSFSAFITRYRLNRLHFFHTTSHFAYHRSDSLHLRDEL